MLFKEFEVPFTTIIITLANNGHLIDPDVLAIYLNKKIVPSYVKRESEITQRGKMFSSLYLWFRFCCTMCSALSLTVLILSFIKEKENKRWISYTIHAIFCGPIFESYRLLFSLQKSSSQMWNISHGCIRAYFIVLVQYNNSNTSMFEKKHWRWLCDSFKFFFWIRYINSLFYK